ncbi:MAG: hypothetical protein M3277_09455 [Actinomycetota bacterium]|nr:hypothetical protein [Actinomycetota bacterium]
MSSPSILQDGVRAAIPAALFSGLPSTVHALLTKANPLEPSLAAGSILLPRETRSLPLLVAAVPVHIALSLGWGVLLAASLPRKTPVAEGVATGLAIAAFDLGVVGSHYPRVRALRLLPQIADHVAFGVVASLALSRGDRS